ncbi:hypothetical protein ACFVYP_26350 [Kitasatospora sp. NPDC058201]|uniref:hypothetical protein n=1 Tax=Streptomycetaceae TaxID=2062 RepID=UPI002E760185|nr:hypothetical protein [Streptomyces sp. BE303]MED7950474.1 hypothetical protein [Streptomyces sp. BE303]
MAAPPPPRRSRFGAAPRAALAALLAVLALTLPVGCAAPGGLRDHGAAQPVTPPPVPQPLWPGLATVPPPTAPAAGTGQAPEPPPQPVPDVTAAGRDIMSVDVHGLLAKDPGVSQDEQRALSACPACELRSPEYRDLTGDGRPELILAVGTAGTAGPVVLHVYTLTGEGLVPVLRVQALARFSAETVGTDLRLHESTSVWVRTTSHYRWDGVRLVLVEQTSQDLGPVPTPSRQPTPERQVQPTVGPVVKPPVTPSAPGPAPSALTPTARPTADSGAAPASPRAGATPPVPVPAQPVRPTTPAAPPEAKP